MSLTRRLDVILKLNLGRSRHCDGLSKNINFLFIGTDKISPRLPICDSLRKYHRRISESIVPTEKNDTVSD